MLARKALAGTAGAPKEYVEDVFSSYLYVGTGANQTITNNIDISGEGGLVWIKGRSPTSSNHTLYDTERGAGIRLRSNLTNAESTNLSGYDLTSFTSSGFTLGTPQDTGVNSNGDTSVSWTFRKAKKFFDVVTYTGDGAVSKNISHNLGSVPGCIIVKCTSTTHPWRVYHRSLGNTKALALDSTDSEYTNSTFWNNTTPTSTVFTVGESAFLNQSGQTYVAYLFAHDAGGFGDAGSDSIIKCGSYTGIGASSGPEIDLGWEPQWLLIKAAESANNWLLFDNMRGMNVIPSDDNVKQLFANTNGAEANAQRIIPTATGFKVTINDSILNSNGATYIYIAIRRGPMKTPETGTSVFTPTAFSGNDTSGTRSAGLNAFDLLIAKRRGVNSLDWVWLDKLRGLAGNKWLASNDTAAEGGVGTINTINGQYTQDGINITKSSNYAYLDSDGNTYIWYAIKRAPKFFDEVCWTGTGSNIDVTHSLGVTPEFIIGKARDYPTGWIVYHKDIGSTGGYPNYMVLNSTQASGSGASTIWRGVSSTTFSYGTNATLNISGINYVAYLFASVSGVSKVGSYTGNGSSVTVTTDFQPRFIMVKRTDSTGNWIVGDSARGLVAGNDPYLLLNSTAADDTDEDWVDITSTSFTVNQTTAANANIDTATYIYLAIA